MKTDFVLGPTLGVLMAFSGCAAAPSIGGGIPIPQRIANQEDRISADLRVGRMAPEPAARWRDNLRSIQAEYQRYLQFNGGRLTQAEFIEINRRLDNTLEFIHRTER